MGNRWLKSVLSNDTNTNVTVPSGYRTTREWVPCIGDIVPNFFGDSTDGPLDFFQYSERHWTFLFNQPNAGGAVCSTEVATLASAVSEFDKKGCRLLCVTQENSLASRQWVKSIESHFRQEVPFPMVSDPDLVISRLFGMTHWREDAGKAVRKTYLIDPSLRVSAILEYPQHMGRSVHEMLRILDARQESERTGLATPCDWHRGEPVVVPNNIDEYSARAKYGDAVRKLAPGVLVVEPT